MFYDGENVCIFRGHFQQNTVLKASAIVDSKVIKKIIGLIFQLIKASLLFLEKP